MGFENLGALFPTILLAVTLLFPVSARKAEAGMAEHPNILRLHVIANSDSDADQAVKLQVRDAILEVMEPGSSADEARRFVLSHGALLQKTAEATLRENGFGYGVQLLLGNYDFPDRTYGGKLYPAGEYEALRVVLGRGEGQNWWCVLFPPLCILEEDAAENPEISPSPADEPITFESSILSFWRNLS